MAQVKERGEGWGRNPSPPPSPSFTFWLSFHFSRSENRKSPSSVFLCPETKRKRLLRRLLLAVLKNFEKVCRNYVSFSKLCFLPSRKLCYLVFKQNTEDRTERITTKQGTNPYLYRRLVFDKYPTMCRSTFYISTAVIRNRGAYFGLVGLARA